MEGTKDEVGVSGRVEALLLLASDLLARPWKLASSFYSLVKSTKGLL